MYVKYALNFEYYICMYYMYIYVLHIYVCVCVLIKLNKYLMFIYVCK